MRRKFSPAFLLQWSALGGAILVAVLYFAFRCYVTVIGDGAKQHERSYRGDEFPLG